MRNGWVVRAPASSANLGSAFDAVAVALDVAARSHRPTATSPRRRRIRPCARSAGAGGAVRLTVRTRIPGGRGLGFSGAARVAGLLAAHVQQGAARRTPGAEVLRVGDRPRGSRRQRGRVAARRGGRGRGRACGPRPARLRARRRRVGARPGNGDRAARRRRLPDQVPFDDAVFNVGRTALLVAALAAGDTVALRIATEDRLHQDRRLAAPTRPASRSRPRSRPARTGRGCRVRGRPRPRSSTRRARDRDRGRAARRAAARSCSRSPTREPP